MENASPMKRISNSRNEPSVRKCHIVLLAALMTLLLYSVPQAREKSEFLRLQVRGDNNYPPYEFINQKGVPDGYNVDIFNAVADVMGIQADLSLGPWNEVRSNLEEGKIDALIGMYYSEERDRMVDFSIPHLIIHHSIFIRRSDPKIDSIEELRGKEVIVQKGDILHDIIQDKKIARQIITVESQPDGLRLLSSGRHDCFLGVKLQGLATIRSYHLYNIITSGPPIYPRKYGFAVTEGDEELVSRLNQGLTIIKQTGQFQKIYEKWFGIYTTDHPWFEQYGKYLVAVFSIIGLCLLATLVWTITLKRQVRRRTENLKQELEERKRAERSLQERESLLHATFESSHDGILVVSAEGRVTQYNSRFCEIWNIAEKMVGIKDGADLMKFVRPQLQDYPEFLSQVQTLYNNSERSCEIIRLKDGRVLEWESYPLIENEHETGRVWIFQDITDQKLYAENMKRNEERFRIALEANPDSIVLYDMKGNVLFFNQAFMDTFGWTLEERIGKKLDDFVPEESWEETRKMILQVLAGKSISGVETYRLTRDGRKLPVMISASIFRDRQGNPEGTIINLKDISENKQLQSELQQAQKMEAIGTLAGGIAHDFNNILAAISGNAELGLYDMEPSDSVYGYLKGIMKACQRAKDLVQQILSFSRQEKSETKAIQPGLIINDVIRLLRATTPANITIRTNIDSTKYIMADPVQIHQILMNLCTNAVYEMQETGGELVIDLDETIIRESERIVPGNLKPGSYVKLCVSDTGQGIAPEIRDRIFEPFFTTKAVGAGTGMGLSVVHGIVQRAGGTITLQSELGKGSRFIIYLPAVEYQQKDKGTVQSQTVIGGTERILFVDDEEQIVGSWQMILSSLGYHVTGKTGSLEAFEQFKNDPDKFDILITDMTMPEMTGDQLARKVKEIRPDLPVILCSGYSAIIDSDRAHSIGIDAFKMKPLLKKEIAEKIRELLDR
jgi:PAS domain S-box-containing protein